ncbi:MAG: hypothetical protein HYU69_09840 [Bacteroidetes bacterium]|nr:hypothetical protein [Bacteroidota bacterium]
MKTKLQSLKSTKVILILVFIGMIVIQANAQWTLYNTGNSGLPVNGITAIAIDAAGNKWIGATQMANFNAGLCKFTGSTWTVWNMNNTPSFPTTNVASIAIDSLGNIWFGSPAGIGKLSGTTITSSALEGNAYIQQLAIDKKGNIWAPSHAGLFRIKRSSPTFSYTVYNSTSAPAMGGAKMNAAAVDNSGDIWSGGWDSGVRKFDGNATWTQYNSGNSVIPGDYTNSMGRDSSGNIWVTSQGTLFGTGSSPYVGKCNGSTWTIYKHMSKGGPVPSSQIYSMAFDKVNGVIWFASADSGLIKFDGTKWKTYKMSNTPGLPSNQINAVAIDKDGSLWVGTPVGLAHWTCTAPTITVSSNVSICLGASSTLSVSGAADNYLWSPATGLNTTTGTSVIASPSTTTTYTVTASKMPGCASSKTITVTITPSPVIANAGSDVSFCAGLSSTLSASGGTTYSWSPATGLSSTSISNPVASPGSSTTYTVVVKDVNGCSNSDQVSVTIKPAPAITANAGSDVSFCPGASATLTASGGTSYSWSPATGLSSTTIANPVASPTVTTTYTVSVSASANGCTGTGTDMVIVNVKPTPNANAGSGAAMCSGDLVPMQASGGGTYSWSPPTGLSSTTIPNPDASPTSDITYTVTVTGTNGCTANSTVSITVYQGPPKPVITKSGNVLTSTNVDVLIYEWYLNGNLIPGANSQSYTYTTQGTYKVVVTNADGCSTESNPFSTTTTGISNLQQENLAILKTYIHPELNEIILEMFSLEKTQYTFELFSISGQQVFINSVGERSGKFTERIVVTDLSKGVYVLSVISRESGMRANKKLIIE